MRCRYGLLVAPGRGPSERKAIRFGHMGAAAHPIHALAALAALAGALTALGRETPAGAGVEAALAAIEQG